MLVAQDAEQNQVRGLLDRARAGRAAVLELVGEPGIGKTALLAQARRMATGFDVAELVGLPAEQTTPYAGLADLVRQCRAAPASILRRTVGRDALDGRPVNELAVGIALIDLLVSRDGVPLLLCVDDAQWLDPETRRPLGFALRRLGGEPVAALVATRSDAPALLDADHRLHLRGLPTADVRALVRAVHTDFSGEVCDALTIATDGNPLAIFESASRLSTQQPSGAAPLQTTAAVPARLREAFTAQLQSLPAPCRRLLLLAAVEGRGDAGLVGAAAAGWGVSLGSVAAAEEAGLVALTGQCIVFAHPLIGATVLAVASPEAVRAAHAAPADSHLATGDGVRALMHACAAALGPDDRCSRRPSPSTTALSCASSRLARSSTSGSVCAVTVIRSRRANSSVPPSRCSTTSMPGRGPSVPEASLPLPECSRGTRVGGVADLSPRELQIALTVAAGRRNKEIAGALFRSVRTVEFHLMRVFIKLGVRSRGELSARLAGQMLGRP